MLISSGRIGASEFQARFYDIGSEAWCSETEEVIGKSGSGENDEGP